MMTSIFTGNPLENGWPLIATTPRSILTLNQSIFAIPNPKKNQKPQHKKCKFESTMNTTFKQKITLDGLTGHLNQSVIRVKNRKPSYCMCLMVLNSFHWSTDNRFESLTELLSHTEFHKNQNHDIIVIRFYSNFKNINKCLRAFLWCYLCFVFMHHPQIFIF